MNPKDPILVNIGCGWITHQSWLNVDMNPTDPTVKPLRPNGGIPLGSNLATACYSSHVLEHIPRRAAAGFILEQKRVLRSGGIIRVVLPDLQFLCREYLAELEACAASGRPPSFRYQHTVAELLDQLVRTHHECRLMDLWKETPPADRDWVATRVGYVAEQVLPRSTTQMASAPPSLGKSRSSPMRLAAKAFARLQEMAAAGAVWAIGGSRLRDAYQSGLYRSRGEIHQWMYDELALQQLLADCGFIGVVRRRLGDSDIPGWSGFDLEIRDGRELKPHSLVMEARKP
jgi:predicted SAM-dependent methyltransferase